MGPCPEPEFVNVQIILFQICIVYLVEDELVAAVGGVVSVECNSAVLHQFRPVLTWNR
jgi:hypothetical protein